MVNVMSNEVDLGGKYGSNKKECGYSKCNIGDFKSGRIHCARGVFYPGFYERPDKIHLKGWGG